MRCEVQPPSGVARRRAFTVLALVIVGSCLWLAFRDVSVAAVTQLLTSAGPQLFWVPLPFCLAQLADAKACQLLFERLERPPSFARMFQAQVAGEASTLALPMGFLVGESLRPWLLAAGNHARLATCIAAVSGRKCLLITAEGVWIGLALALAPGAASVLSQQLLGGRWLLGASVLLSLLFIGVGLSMALFLGGGHLAAKLFQRVARVVPARFRARVVRAESYFTRTDAQLARVFGAPRGSLVAPCMLYLCVWLLEGLEVWLILHLLHVDVPITTAFYIEAIVASCRSLLPLTPAGLGVQDAGYVACFTALGVPGALGVGAAFCLAKRTRELIWCALGALCWTLARRPAAQAAAEAALALAARASVPVLALDGKP